MPSTSSVKSCFQEEIWQHCTRFFFPDSSSFTRMINETYCVFLHRVNAGKKAAYFPIGETKSGAGRGERGGGRWTFIGLFHLSTRYRTFLRHRVFPLFSHYRYFFDNIIRSPRTPRPKRQKRASILGKLNAFHVSKLSIFLKYQKLSKVSIHFKH